MSPTQRRGGADKMPAASYHRLCPVQGFMSTVWARDSEMGEVARARAVRDSSTEQAAFRRISTDLHKKRKYILRVGVGGASGQEEEPSKDGHVCGVLGPVS